MAIKASKAMGDRLKDAGGKTSRKLKPREKPVETPSDRASDAMEKAVVLQSQIQADAVQKMIIALEAMMNENRIAKSAQPVRLKIHRDSNNLIEYIDVVPIEVKRVLN